MGDISYRLIQIKYTNIFFIITNCSGWAYCVKDYCRFDTDTYYFYVWKYKKKRPLTFLAAYRNTYYVICREVVNMIIIFSFTL